MKNMGNMPLKSRSSKRQDLGSVIFEVGERSSSSTRKSRENSLIQAAGEGGGYGSYLRCWSNM